jgi:hypothetical protein
MAFKRSAVRLRLAPPLKILSCSNYSVADFRGEVTPVARGKHQESTLVLSLPPHVARRRSFTTSPLAHSDSLQVADAFLYERERQLLAAPRH